MLATHLALVSDTAHISGSQLNRVAAALQKQATRDFAAVWNVSATIDGFERLEDVPVGYWPVIVRDDIDEPGAAGVHLDDQGQPFALVQYSESWSLTASHETLEMLADPQGNRLVSGRSLKPDQGLVEFLVEVADPPEDAQFGYLVNEMLVSDFITPNFYDPVPTQGVRYSFAGHVTAPRTILEGGYITWHEPATDHWWQQTWFDGTAAAFRDLGRMGTRSGSLRSAIDARTGTALRMAATGPKSRRLAQAKTLTAQTVPSKESRAAAWRTQIEALRVGKITEAVWEDPSEHHEH